jgi:NTP pyrophosphatase (non-canonical NTP hydrolase)
VDKMQFIGSYAHQGHIYGALEGARATRQHQARRWAERAFGADHVASVSQRGARHLEEAIEAAQAAGVQRDMAHRLVDYIFDRPAGDLHQEIGGSGLTLLLLAAAAGLDADAEEDRELRRVSKSPEHFRARNEAKNAAGFDTSKHAAAPPPVS